MDNSSIEELQSRFRLAASLGEGLTLSPSDVALLASFEEEPAPPSLPMGNVDKVLAHITPRNPISLFSNDIASPITWSLFLSWLSLWDKEGNDWTFTREAATVKTSGVTFRIPFDTPYLVQPELPLDHGQVPRQPLLPSERVR